jgi:hypothetical protein
MRTSSFSYNPVLVVSSRRMKAFGGSPPVASRTLRGSMREAMDRGEKE